MTADTERKTKEREFTVYLEGTWFFHYSAWGDSPEAVQRQAMREMELIHGEDFLEFSGVRVTDGRTDEPLLAWTPERRRHFDSRETEDVNDPS